MKALLFVFPALLTLTIAAAPPTKTFDQKVDHFNPLDTRTYKQRYNVDIPTGWQTGDPIFIFLAGEAPMEFFEFQEVQARLWAKEFGAIYISLEHRFYGESIPLKDQPKGPYSTDNLAYLSSQQALADAANFIEQFKTTLEKLSIKYGIKIEEEGKESKWIVFGCSYSGALSSWFRLKYPHLVVGSVAPSGPVYAVNNYTGYYAHFQKVAPISCINAVKSAVSSILQSLKSDSGRSYLSETFNSCGPISSDVESQYYFLLTLTEAIGGSDQFENPPDWPLNQTCKIMTSSNDYVGNWAKILNQQSPYLSRKLLFKNLLRNDNKRSKATCNDFNEKSSFIDPMINTDNQDRSWVFQQCSEFGFWMPTYGSIFFPDQLDLSHQLKWCDQIYGMQPANTEWTNAYYGGYNLHGTNIMFTNGIFDPWHLLSINDNVEWGGVYSVTYAAGHCAPMTQEYDDDPQSLKNARKVVHSFLQKLLL